MCGYNPGSKKLTKAWTSIGITMLGLTLTFALESSLSPLSHLFMDHLSHGFMHAIHGFLGLIIFVSWLGVAIILFQLCHRAVTNAGRVIDYFSNKEHAPELAALAQKDWTTLQVISCQILGCTLSSGLILILYTSGVVNWGSMEMICTVFRIMTVMAYTFVTTHRQAFVVEIMLRFRDSKRQQRLSDVQSTSNLVQRTNRALIKAKVSRSALQYKQRNHFSYFSTRPSLCFSCGDVSY
jgi:hypothetical protein